MSEEEKAGPPKGPKPEDLKVMLQHLRGIHLAFVLAALAIFTALSGSNRTYETAIEQLRDLVTLTSSLTEEALVTGIMSRISAKERPNSMALHDFIDGAVGEYFEANELYVEGLSVSGIDLALTESDSIILEFDDRYEGDSSWRWFETRSALIGNGGKVHTSPYELFDSFSASLSGRADRLDRLLEADTLYAHPSFHAGYFGTGTAVSDIYPGLSQDIRQRFAGLEDVAIFARVKAVRFTDGRSLETFKSSQEYIMEDPHGYVRYGFRFDEILISAEVRAGDGTRFDFELTLPVMFEREPFEFVSESMQALDENGVYRSRYLSGARSFERLFPELASVTANLGSLRPAELEIYLEEQKQKSAAPISVLGLEIGRDLIEVWGILLMLGIQLYFCMHYRTFLDRVSLSSEEPEFPWIAVYRQWIASLVFQVSLAFPLAVTLASVIWFQDLARVTVFDGAKILLAAVLFLWAEAMYLEYWRNRKRKAAQSSVNT